MKTTIPLILLFALFSHSTKSQVNLQYLLNRKQYVQIVSHASNLRAKDSSDYQTMYLIGQGYEGLLKYRDAYKYYHHCLSIDSTQTELLNTIARITSNMGRTQEAKQYYLKILEYDSTDFYANYQLARFYIQAGDDEEASFYYQYLLEQDPDNPILRKALGDCYYRLDEKYFAVEEYLIAFQNNKENVVLASTLINTLLHIGGGENAIAICDTALRYNPENRTLLQNKGIALFTTKKYPEADSIFSNLLEKGDSSYLTLKYGGCSKYYAGKYMDAIEPLDKAYEQDTTSVEICLLLGSTLGRTYDRIRAYQLLDQAERLIQPNKSLVNMLVQFRGDTYARDGRLKESAALYYQLWKENQRYDLLALIWSYSGTTDIAKLEDNDSRQRSLLINVLIASEYKNYEKNKPMLSFTRSQLQKFKEEMFFKGVKELSMIAPDNIRSKISSEKLDELIQQLPKKILTRDPL